MIAPDEHNFKWLLSPGPVCCLPALPVQPPLFLLPEACPACDTPASARFQMVSLRSKLHLARQGRKSSPRLISDSPCLLDNEYDAAAATAAPTQRAGIPSAPEPSHLPSWSSPRRLALDTLPEELVQKVAIFCGSDAIQGLRHTCRTLHRALDTPNFLAEIARRRVSLSRVFFFFLPPPPPS